MAPGDESPTLILHIGRRAQGRETGVRQGPAGTQLLTATWEKASVVCPSPFGVLKQCGWWKEGPWSPKTVWGALRQEAEEMSSCLLSI